MANKNSNIEKKNETVVEPVMEDNMTHEEMEKFVNDNLSIVPRNMRKKFNGLSLEEKVKKIHMYKDMKTLKYELFEKNKLENKVKELFIKRKATTEEVVKVIDFCKQYIQTTKQEEINKLQDEIERLTHLKQTLETN
jgi:hypothetical protein